jgi:hypothetical protein
METSNHVATCDSSCKDFHTDYARIDVRLFLPANMQVPAANLLKKRMLLLGGQYYLPNLGCFLAAEVAPQYPNTNRTQVETSNCFRYGGVISKRLEKVGISDILSVHTTSPPPFIDF